MSEILATEFDILADVISPDSELLDPDAARALLKWKFSPKSVARMNWLAERNASGTITAAERDELERFIRVGSLVDLIQAKARFTLSQVEAKST